MDFSYLTISLIAFSSAFAQGPPPPAPSLPAQYYPLIVPLPAEKDGVLPNGTVINATPDSPTNPQSCFTEPVGSPILGIDSHYTSGLCQVCVVQNSTGNEASDLSSSYLSSSYELWVRDDDNHAIGGAGPQMLAPLDESSGPPDYINFTTGGKAFNMWSMLSSENHKFSTVFMVWDKSVMQFNSDPPFNGTNCKLMGSTDSSGVLYFQCGFLC